jgi:hypothetical protein
LSFYHLAFIIYLMTEAKRVTEKVEKVYSEGVVSTKKIKPDLRKTELPLVDIKITNPITYIKSWWRKIIGNEGIEIKIRVRPLTAIAISIIVVTAAFGIGRFVLPFKIPFFVYKTQDVTLPVIESPEYRDTAFTGTLRRAVLSNRYYLITSSSEAINLEVPENIVLEDFIGRRIFAAGKYHEETRTLLITEATDLELLPSTVEAIPTVEITLPPEVTIAPEVSHTLLPET